jgi:hypothetical protein
VQVERAAFPVLEFGLAVRGGIRLRTGTLRFEDVVLVPDRLHRGTDLDPFARDPARPVLDIEVALRPDLHIRHLLR